MTATVHLLVGASTTAVTNNPYLAFFLGLLSHFILDTIPHIDAGVLPHREDEFTPKMWFWAGLDVILGLLILLFLFYKFRDPILLWGASGAILPDFLDNTPFWTKYVHNTKLGRIFHNFHDGIQKYNPKLYFWFWGFLPQIILVGVILWYLLKL